MIVSERKCIDEFMNLSQKTRQVLIFVLGAEKRLSFRVCDMTKKNVRGLKYKDKFCILLSVRYMKGDVIR